MLIHVYGEDMYVHISSNIHVNYLQDAQFIVNIPLDFPT